MKSVLNFWNKDVINKLIVLVSIGVLGGAIIIGYLLITMKSDSIFYEVFSPVLGKSEGVPTMAVSVTVGKPTETAFPIPTFTEFPSAEPTTIELITDTPSGVIELPTQALIQATSTVIPASQVTVQSSVQASACIPDNSPQTGKVLDVIDGNTIKVLINGSAYTVRYIGIEVPRYKPAADYFGQEADFKNAEYVFAKEIILIADKVDKDDAGRLLRYVKSGDVFVNYELVKQGFASAIAGPAACASLFQDAELSAKQLKLGKWNPTPTPPSP